MSEYVVGLALAAAVAAIATATGMARERSFYSTALIVIASYYVLFAVMGGSTRALALETAVAAAFALAAVLGFKRNMWLVAAGIAAHGLFDFVHHLLIANPGMPSFWPGFCGSVDVALGDWMGFRLARGQRFTGD